MDVDYLNKSASGTSEMNGLSSSEELIIEVDGMKVIQTYTFEPVEIDSGGEDFQIRGNGSVFFQL